MSKSSCLRDLSHSKPKLRVETGSDRLIGLRDKTGIIMTLSLWVKCFNDTLTCSFLVSFKNITYESCEFSTSNVSDYYKNFMRRSKLVIEFNLFNPNLSNSLNEPQCVYLFRVDPNLTSCHFEVQTEKDYME